MFVNNNFAASSQMATYSYITKTFVVNIRNQKVKQWMSGINLEYPCILGHYCVMLTSVDRFLCS